MTLKALERVLGPGFALGPAFALGAALALGAACGGCARSPAPPARVDEPVLIHAPPIKQLDLKQLKALSLECEKYLAGQFARGPYDAAYCQAAIDAWGDAPLQMVRIPPTPPASPGPPGPPGPPAARSAN